MTESLSNLQTSKSTGVTGKVTIVGIVGGGVMGQGIAQVMATNGIDVILVEKNDDLAIIAKSQLESSMDKEIERWSLTGAEKNSILARIQFKSSLQTISHVPIVIEAITEDFSLKKRLFNLLDQQCDSETILVSNTSTLNLSNLAENISNPERVIGMHFLNPVPKIPLVELIRATRTSDSTFEKIKTFAEQQLAKTVVEVYEYPGFVTTRVIIPMINEAIHVFAEGIATVEGIDTAMKLGYGFQTGPLAMADLMGLDDVLRWMDQLWQQLGETKFRPAPILRRMVREGRLGKKTGRGFYEY